MLAHPILINRPIVVTPKGVRLMPSVRSRSRYSAESRDWTVREGRRRSGHRSECRRVVWDLPNIDAVRGRTRPIGNKLQAHAFLAHKPRILLLYGSLRERSFSRLLDGRSRSATRVRLGRNAEYSTPPVCRYPTMCRPIIPRSSNCANCRAWSEGQVWSSPERHGTITRHHEGADRLDPALDRRRPADAGQDRSPSCR